MRLFREHLLYYLFWAFHWIPMLPTVSGFIQCLGHHRVQGSPRTTPNFSHARIRPHDGGWRGPVDNVQKMNGGIIYPSSRWTNIAIIANQMDHSYVSGILTCYCGMVFFVCLI